MDWFKYQPPIDTAYSIIPDEEDVVVFSKQEFNRIVSAINEVATVLQHNYSMPSIFEEIIDFSNGKRPLISKESMKNIVKQIKKMEQEK